MRSLCITCKTVAIALGAASCFVITLDGTACAQGINPRTAGAMRRAEKMQRQNEEYERDNLKREMETGPHKSNGRRNEAVTAQVKQDFEKLQAAYNRIVLAMATKESFNLNSVLAEVADVKKYSTRLKSNLALPQPEDDGKKSVAKPPADGQIEESLLSLRKHIYDFITNPLFDAPAAYKIDEARKAARDLENVIELSESIRKSNKTAEENR